MDGNGGVETEPLDVAFDKILHGAAGNWTWEEPLAACRACGFCRPEQRPFQVLAEVRDFEPCLQALDGFGVQWHPPFLAAFPLQFQEAVAGTCFEIADGLSARL